jgi:hypothetical protein
MTDATQPLPISPEQDTQSLYSAEEVLRNFEGLLDSFDFKAELPGLGIGGGPLQMTRRKKAVRELNALTVGLWHLALLRSFPNDADDFLKRYLATSPRFAGSDKESAKLRARIGIYVDLLKDKRDTDFLPVASYLAEVLALNAEDSASLRLKVSLLTRSLYTWIFDRLV